MLGSKVSCIVLFLLSAFVCDIHNFDYSDLQTLGVACGDQNPTSTTTPPDSCVGYTISTHYTEKNCECDLECNYFDDCCIDAQITFHVQAQQRTPMTCLRHETRDRWGVYVIANCSKSWHGASEIRQRCEGPQNFSDPLNAAPVTSVVPRVTYKNRFCAECNHAELRTLQTFQLKLTFEERFTVLSDQQIMANLEYNETLDSWGVHRLNSLDNTTYFANCEITFNVPDYLNNSVRFCRPNLISSCPPNWRRQIIRRGCDEYMAVVYDNYNDAYRNPHCAICNGRHVDEISCLDELSYISIRRRLVTMLLLDVNKIDSDLLGMRQTATTKCLANHTYDPFFKKCRHLVCPLWGYVVVDGQCVKENSTVSVLF